MAEVVYFRGARSELRHVLLQFVRSLGGRSAEYREFARGVFLAIGFQAVGDVQADFARKARGETGEDGVRWPRLSPKTLAYSRRFGPGEKSRLKKAAGLGRANNQRGLLTKAQDKRWRQIYGTRLARFAASMPLGAAKAKAAQVAWATLKAEGAKTKLEVYGNRPHEVLRDTGVLFNSLSQGELSGNGVGAGYNPPEGQVFEIAESGVIVGTNVPYAGSHQHGDAKRGIPARPFLPRAAPQVWLARWAEVGLTAASAALRIVLMQGVRRA